MHQPQSLVATNVGNVIGRSRSAVVSDTSVEFVVAGALIRSPSPLQTFELVAADTSEYKTIVAEYKMETWRDIVNVREFELYRVTHPSHQKQFETWLGARDDEYDTATVCLSRNFV